MTIIQMLQNYFKDFDLAFDFDDDFSYDLVNEIVYIPYKNSIHDVWADLFSKNFIEHCAIATNYSVYLLSLLHEIGHSETVDYFDYDDDTNLRQICNMLEPKEAAPLYFALPMENDATDWAIDFLQKNQISLQKLDSELQKYVAS